MPQSSEPPKKPFRVVQDAAVAEYLARGGRQFMVSVLERRFRSSATLFSLRKKYQNAIILYLRFCSQMLITLDDGKRSRKALWTYVRTPAIFAPSVIPGRWILSGLVEDSSGIFSASMVVQQGSKMVYFRDRSTAERTAIALAAAEILTNFADTLQAGCNIAEAINHFDGATKYRSKQLQLDKHPDIPETVRRKIQLARFS